MVFYGISGPGVSHVTKEWKQIEDIAAVVPYCSYRKFYTEEDAWNFVKSHKWSNNKLFMRKYGDTFDEPYLTLRYIIFNNKAYYTFDTTNFGRIHIDVEDALVQYKAHCILIKKDFGSLNPNMILDHLKVICEGVGYVGSFIDIDLIIPNHSIFYALTCYNGNNKDILYYKNIINSRLARVSTTLEVKPYG